MLETDKKNFTPKVINFENEKWNYRSQSLKKEVICKQGSLFSLSNGYIGLRGSFEEIAGWENPEFYIAGSYALGPVELLGLHDPDHILVHPERINRKWLESKQKNIISTLPNMPYPIGVEMRVGEIKFSYENAVILSNERRIEIDKAVLKRTMVFRNENNKRTRIDSCRFVSFSEPGLICLKYRATPIDHNEKIDLKGFIGYKSENAKGICLWKEIEKYEKNDLKSVLVETSGSGIKIAIAQETVITRCRKFVELSIFAHAGEKNLDEAVCLVKEFRKKGFERCETEHIEAYKEQLNSAYLEFEENPDTIKGFNFGQMHLQMAFPYKNNRVGIPIKGLTGQGYRFCNFWDMDFHMFPYYLMTKPKSVHVLLEYRYNQLSKYRENAVKWGARGAQVPWETQVAGNEETAPWLCLQDREIHISADAAYMFKLYDDLTPDHSMMIEKGAEFIIETARFYVSRIKWSQKNQRYELPDIGCADQYHTFADNSFFISSMAKWNINYAINLAKDKQYEQVSKKINVKPEEMDERMKIVGNFYIIEPDKDGIIEEFEGYFKLSTDINGISETYCSHSQAVKQPDVLAAMVTLENLYEQKIWEANWKYYSERTLHGSSLSLPGMAFSAARCGLNDQALYYLHKSARMDLDDVNMDVEKGIHVSGAAIEWQAVVFGFGGLIPQKEGLFIKPNLPKNWKKLNFSVFWKFQKIYFYLSDKKFEIRSCKLNRLPVPVFLSENKKILLNPGECYEKI